MTHPGTARSARRPWWPWCVQSWWCAPQGRLRAAPKTCIDNRQAGRHLRGQGWVQVGRSPRETWMHRGMQAGSKGTTRLANVIHSSIDHQFSCGLSRSFPELAAVVAAQAGGAAAISNMPINNSTATTNMKSTDCRLCRSHDACVGCVTSCCPVTSPAVH